jgi:hypothetical protein
MTLILDPDPAFYSNAGPDLASKNIADLDPQPSYSFPES